MVSILKSFFLAGILLPKQVPFSLKEELHLNFDALAVHYRQGMVAEGLDYSFPKDDEEGE